MILSPSTIRSKSWIAVPAAWRRRRSSFSTSFIGAGCTTPGARDSSPLRWSASPPQDAPEQVRPVGHHPVHAGVDEPPQLALLVHGPDLDGHPARAEVTLDGAERAP